MLKPLVFASYGPRNRHETHGFHAFCRFLPHVGLGIAMTEREPHTVRTWTVTERTAERIKALATETEAWDSHLVEMILARGLDAIDSGQWPLKRVPVKFEIKW